MYNKKVLNRATAGLDKAKAPAKKKDIIVDPMGQWKHPGENTRIPSSNITMQGVNYPVLGVGSNGQEQMMYPGMEYTFPGADYVDEFPQGTDEDYFEADLTDAEIEEYRKGGYIVEDISVPQLDKAQVGKINGRAYFSPYEYNYDTRALRTKEDLDPAIGLGITKNKLFSGRGTRENDVTTAGTISTRIPYNNPKPSIRGQLDVKYQPKNVGSLIPSTNTMMGVGYDPTVGFNSDINFNQRFGFANVRADAFKNENWRKGSATWGVGPALEVSYQSESPATLQGQKVDPNFNAPSTRGAQWGAGLYGDVSWQPFDYPMHIGADAKIIANPFSQKSANTGTAAEDENLNWTVNPGAKVYASFPLTDNSVKRKNKVEEQKKIDEEIFKDDYNIDKQPSDNEPSSSDGDRVKRAKRDRKKRDYEPVSFDGERPIGYLPGYDPESGREVGEQYTRRAYGFNEGPTMYQTGGGTGSFYTVPGSDGVYRKVNGKWQVDWNRSGNFQPLAKGDVAKRTDVLNKQAKPLYDADYDSLVASRKYESAPAKAAAKPQTATQKKAQQNFNQNFKVSAKDDYTKVQDKIKRDQQNLIEWGAANDVPITQKEIDDVENWGWNVYGKVGVQGRPDQINSYTPDAPQGFLDKAADIVSNPMTSAGYFMRGQDIPDYMQRDMDRGTFGYYANGDLHTERNPLDFVSDFTPLGLVNDTRNVISGISEGDLGKTGLGLLSAVPGFGELRSASKALKAADKFSDVSKGASKLDVKLLPDEVRSKELDMETFGIYKGEQRVGEVSGNRLSNGDFETADIGIDPQFQKQGIGTETYKQLNQSLPEGNKVRSWGAFVEENGVAPGRNTWQSLEKKGLAKKNEKGTYEMLPNSTSNSDKAVKAGFDGNFITRPLTLFGKNELTPGNQWYRKIGNEAGLRDLINKQGAQAPAPMRMRSGMTLDAPFFGRGAAPNENYKGLFAVEVKPEAASKYNWRSRVAGVDNYGSVPLTNEGIMQNMPLEDLNVYKKKWFSNNYKKLDPNNLEKNLMNAPVQRTLENAYKWGARGYLGKSAYDYMNQPKENVEPSDYYQKGGKLGPIHLNEGRKTLRDYVYGADIGMMQEQDGGVMDAELTDEEIQAYRDAGYYIEELD